MDILVGRQPILDRRKRTVAYELLFRSGAGNKFDGLDGNVATKTVVGNTFLTLGCERVLTGKCGFINFPRQLLIEDSGLLLPRDRVVIEILEDVEADAQVLASCHKLKEAGYRIALDDVIDTDSTAPFWKYADYAKIDLLALGVRERRQVCGFFLKKGLRLVAEKVETIDDFESSLTDGCELFQGYFFARPEIVSGRQVPVSKISCLRLLQQVHQPDLDFEDLEEIIRLDIGLTRKLLCFVNSAASPLRYHVQSVGQAFVGLGEHNIRQWIMLAALPALASRKPAELITTSLVRAHFCELAADLFGLHQRAPAFFLVGLLSLLDAMIGRPLEEVVGDMALDASVSDAIMGTPGVGGDLRSALEMAMAFERSDFRSVDLLTATAGISSTTASELYMEAIAWADTLPR